MTAVMCSEVASNASNLLMDIKPGYMLGGQAAPAGGRPRDRHRGGGARGDPALLPVVRLTSFDAAAGRSVMDTMVTDKFAFPAALQWKGVSDLVTAVFGGDTGRTMLTNSILWSMGVAGFAALVMEVLRIRSRNRFPLSRSRSASAWSCRRTRR